VKPSSVLKRSLLIAIPCFFSLALWSYLKGDLFSFFSKSVPLAGNVPEIVHHSHALHHADGKKRLEIVVGLKTRNDIELDGLIVRQHDPDSRDYQRFITVEEFTERFAPTQGQVDEVVKFLKDNGLTVEEIYENRLLIRASGTVQQLESGFKVKINEYQVNGSPVRQSMSGSMHGSVQAAVPTYFSNDRDPSVPSELSDIVQSVIGLDTQAVLHKHIAHDDPVTTTTTPPVQQPPVPTQPQLPIQAPLTPQQVASVYNFPNANNRIVAARRYSGKGVNLAIATAEGYDKAEVETYWKTTGVHRTGTLTDITVGGPSAPGDETMLDLELAGAQAPGANILMYMATTPQLLFFTITYAKVVIENKADVMTSSWGLCEDGTGPRMMGTEENLFRQAAVQGIAVFFSAGDAGAYDCGPRKTPPVLAVDYPSSSQYVTAVGGTSLRVDKYARTSETIWKKGGGGVSKTTALPVWQVAKTLPPGNFRATSDVSLVSDPRTGYMYLFKGKWENIGGTSAASPTWAALWTLVTEATGQRVGSANYYVYRMGNLPGYSKLFYDVTVGDNGFGVGAGYPAGPGWDVPSGWGTPNGLAITDWMISVSPVKAPEDRRLGQKHPPKPAKPQQPSTPTTTTAPTTSAPLK